MLNIWTKESGTNLSPVSLQEGTLVSILLPTTGDISQITFNVISGNLPAGLVVVDDKIVGTVSEVPTITTSTFVIRASTDSGEISDRTFLLTVSGEDVPIWVTDPGLLPVNPNGLAYVLDSTYIDFQLQAVDTDLAAGESLEFFIEDNNGELPPGLSLSDTGRITGIIDPIIALDIPAGSGFFDTNLFDSNAFDFGLDPAFGRTPKKLNRNYEFVVTVTDGKYLSSRKFRIYVVGDDFLRADNTIIQIGNGAYTADNTYLRPPVWLTANNLGVKRANNYVTVFLDAFDPNPALGPVFYNVSNINDDGTVSKLPDGLYIDYTNGELFGFVPYQPAVTKEYKFTVTATKYDINYYLRTEVAVVVYEDTIHGQYVIKVDPLTTNDAERIVTQPIRIGNNYYSINGYDGPEITGASYALLRLNNKLIIDIPKNTLLTSVFVEAAKDYNKTSSSKTFVLSIIGEVESVIQWITPSNLGSLRVNLPSMLNVKAQTTVPKAVLKYSITNGTLPPGISLSSSGDLVGIVKSNAVLSADKTYNFTILAEDQFKFSSISRTFTVLISAVDDRLYSNIFVMPYQKEDKRKEFFNFISDTSIFTPSKIYRLGDPAFGVQSQLKMLIYAGIETLQIDSYIPALETNVKRKRFRLGTPKKALGKLYGDNNTEYEVIYLEVFDEYEYGITSVGATQDSVGTTVYPCSVTNIRNNIRNLQSTDSTQALTENEFLPLWMLTPQTTKTAATGYVKAIPLCYCKPGEGDYVLLNIQKSGFDFTSIDYDIDRLIIDSTTESASLQYLKFANSKNNV